MLLEHRVWNTALPIFQGAPEESSPQEQKVLANLRHTLVLVRALLLLLQAKPGMAVGLLLLRLFTRLQGWQGRATPLLLHYNLAAALPLVLQ